jgi:resuscitation-promoting factor RpfB
VKLYQPILILFFSIFLFGCEPVSISPDDINVAIRHDGVFEEIKVPAGSSVKESIELLGIDINLLDKSKPPFYSILSPDQEIDFIRVSEEFEIEEIVLPYETQILSNESLSDGERRLIEPGVNGSQEVTVRITFENGIETNRNIVKNTIIVNPVAEIVMIGTQGSYGSIPINGNLIYILGGNAWLMGGDTGLRRPIVTSGDLDGRVFSLSPDGNWVLYTRTLDEDEYFNSLWVTRIDEDPSEEILSIDLKINNIPHYAGWLPDSENSVAYSTAEKIAHSPGWEADNNLKSIVFSANGWVSNPKTLVEPNSGGVYGWWGTDFVWSPDGDVLIYSRPDSIGIVDFESGNLNPIYDISPLQTGSGWAWSPVISWAENGEYIYFSDNKSELTNIGNDETKFDLIALNMENYFPVTIERNVGMFPFAVAQPKLDHDESYQIAYLRALVPDKSEKSGYRLGVMDQDGSNNRLIFPSAGSIGITPIEISWEPYDENFDKIERFIAVIHLGNLWLVEYVNGSVQQLTGDGAVIAIDWK